jgi:hypothetical protein
VTVPKKEGPVGEVGRELKMLYSTGRKEVVICLCLERRKLDFQ